MTNNSKRKRTNLRTVRECASEWCIRLDIGQCGQFGQLLDLMDLRTCSCPPCWRNAVSTNRHAHHHARIRLCLQSTQ